MDIARSTRFDTVEAIPAGDASTWLKACEWVGEDPPEEVISRDLRWPY